MISLSENSWLMKAIIENCQFSYLRIQWNLYDFKLTCNQNSMQVNEVEKRKAYDFTNRLPTGGRFCDLFIIKFCDQVNSLGRKF